MATRDEESIRDAVGRAIDDGKAFVRAEVDLYKAVALAKVDAVKRPAIFGVVALFLAQAALTTLLVAVGMALGPLIGPALGMFAAALIGFAIVGLLVYLAMRSFA